MENNETIEMEINLSDQVENNQIAYDLAVQATMKAVDQAETVLRLAHGNEKDIPTAVAARHMTVLFFTSTLLRPLLSGIVEQRPREEWDQRAEQIAHDFVTHSLSGTLRSYMDQIESENQEAGG